MLYDDSVWVLDIPKARSSLIRRLEYDEQRKILIVYLHFSKYGFRYEDVPWSSYEDMCNSESIGKYYNSHIKSNFKQVKSKIMAEEKKKIPTKNTASDKKRYIDMSLNVREIEKAWIRAGEKGDWLNIRLALLPDGTVDKYGQLGMVTQPVPSEVYKAAEAKEKGSGKKLNGKILGNGVEFDWPAREGAPGSNDGILASELTEPLDNLPF